jgi:dTDP-glucose pyrophosphorylase
MPKINTVIPMAGYGSRFEQAGYTFPKPLITVNGKPMIQLVIENMTLKPPYLVTPQKVDERYSDWVDDRDYPQQWDQQFIFITQKRHSLKYDLKDMLQFLAPGCIIHELDHVTDGAACTVLTIKEYIDNDTPLFMANSDQFVEWNYNDTVDRMWRSGDDGGMVVFDSVHPKNSFAKIDENGYVTEVAEKKVISNLATNGLYYWHRGHDFVKYAEQMIASNKRVNGEFYVAPVYQEAINDGKKFKTYTVRRHWPIGIPEDLRYFEEHYGV